MTIETLRTTRSALMKRLREAKAVNEWTSYIRGLEVEIERADQYIKMMETPSRDENGYG